MSRILAFVFVLADVAATAVSFVHSSLTFTVVALAFVVSLTLGGLSVFLRALFWPRYFWDEPA